MYSNKSDTSTLQKIKEIKASIKGDTFKSYYLIYGEEAYLINDLESTFINHFNQKDNINISVFTEDNYNERVIKEKLSQYGLFNDKKILIFEHLNLFDLKSKHQGIVELLEYNNDNNIDIFIETKIDKRSKLYKMLSEKDSIDILECREQSKAILLKFINDKIYKSKRKFENDNDALYFLELIGNDLYTIKNETDKLIDYTEGKYVITREDIDNIASIVSQERIFQMIDMINNKDYSTALKLYSDLLYNNVAIEQILSLMKNNYIQLYKIKVMKQEGKSFDYMLSNIKTQDWILEKNVKLVRNFSEAELAYKIDILSDIDTKLKTGRLDRNVAFNLLLQ